MAGGPPREGTFTRDLRINASRAASSDRHDEAAVLRSPTHHPSSVGPAASFAEPVSLAKTRQRREVQLAGPRSPAAYSHTAGVPPSASPSHALSHTASPAFGADRTSSKPLLSPTGRRRSRSYFSHSNLRMTLVLLTGGVVVLFFILNHSLRVPLPESQPASGCEAPYDTLERNPHPLHHTMHEGEHGDFPMHTARASIALVTMADTRKVPLPKNLAYLSDIKPGSIVNILDVVWRNRQEYADRHGYTLVNGTDLVAKDRPPSWYKLKIVESVLDEYDWVFYLDPDAWITNPEIPLEAVLPAPGGADFVVTKDAAGANAGSWVIRSSDWSREFISRWWGMDSFIRPPGDTKSGDNDALKHLLGTMDATERARRIAVPPQCALNSYLWRPSVRQWSRWFSSSSEVRSGIWRPGHLLVHLAGWDNYKGLMQLQKLFVSSHDLTRRSSSGLPLPRLSRKHLAPLEPVAAVRRVPNLGTSMPDGTPAGGSGSQSGASTAEFTSSELSQNVAADTASGGAGALGMGSVSLRRRASALLNNPSKDLGAAWGVQSKAASGKATASLRAGALGIADTGDSSSCSPDETLSGGCQDATDSRASEDSESGDYSNASDDELADLGLQITDQDTDDMQAIDAIFGDKSEEGGGDFEGAGGSEGAAAGGSEGADADQNADTDQGTDVGQVAEKGGDPDQGADPGADSDADSANDQTVDYEGEGEDEDSGMSNQDEELLVLEIADEVVDMLKQRKKRVKAAKGLGLKKREGAAKGLGRRGVGGGSVEADVADDDAAGSGAVDGADYENGDGVRLMERDQADYEAGAEVREVDQELDVREVVQETLKKRDVQNSRRDFLKGNADRTAGMEGDDSVQQRGRSLLQETELSGGALDSDVRDTVTAMRTEIESVPKRLAVGVQSIRELDTYGSMLIQQLDVAVFKQQWSKSVDASQSATNVTAGGMKAPQGSESGEIPDVEERGGRPYEALEEIPGSEDQDYEEHSEDVHSRVNFKPDMVYNGPLAAATAAPYRIRRHTILEMSTEEIDALEEDTQLSAEDAKQLFGLGR